MEHSKEFEQLVNDIRRNVREIPVTEALERVQHGATLIDVREDGEWELERAAGAEHIGRGVIERDIVWKHPDKDQELILYAAAVIARRLRRTICKRWATPMFIR